MLLRRGASLWFGSVPEPGVLHVPIVHYHNPQLREIAGPDGLRIGLRPGEIMGAFHIQREPDGPGAGTDERGLSRVSFGFQCDDGTPVVYVGVLKPYAYLPPSGSLVKYGPGQRKRDVALHTVLDSRDVWPFRGSDGADDALKLKYADAHVALSLGEQAVHVGLRIHQETDRSGASSVYRELSYDLPLEHLLWRPAPRDWGGGDVEPEAADHVDLRIVDRSMREIRPSSIHLLSLPQG